MFKYIARRKFSLQRKYGIILKEAWGKNRRYYIDDIFNFIER